MSVAYTWYVPLPLRGCSSNARSPGSWRIKQEATRQYRAECYYTYRERPAPPIKSMAIIDLTVHVARAKAGLPDGRYRPKDVSNSVAAFKAGQDALVDAGILSDDHADCLRLGSVRIVKGTGKACVEVTIREAVE